MFAAIIAQVAADVQPIASWGVGGGVVAWICVRVEKRLDKIDHTMKGLSMALLMDLSTRKVLGPTAQRMVDEALAKMGVTAEE